MSQENSTQDPLEFMRGMWSKMGFSLPGMVTPTMDVDELDKRIADMKAVEGWLKMNLNMLQMTTQGLEMQRSTIAAVQAMSQVARGDDAEPGGNPFAASMWPWNLMQPGQPGATAEGSSEDPAKQAGKAKPRAK